MPDIHPLLQQAIEERSSYLLTVYADWLADRGDPLAEGFRGIAEAPEGDKYDGWLVVGGVYADKNTWAITVVRRKWPDGFAAELAKSRKGIGSKSGYTHFRSQADALTAAAEAFLAVRACTNP